MERPAVSKNIQAIRTAAGLTQEEFAKAIGTSKVTVSSWENKGIRPRNHAIIDAICSTFHVTEQDIFGFDDGFHAKHLPPSKPQPVSLEEAREALSCAVRPLNAAGVQRVADYASDIRFNPSYRA